MTPKVPLSAIQFLVGYPVNECLFTVFIYIIFHNTVNKSTVVVLCGNIQEIFFFLKEHKFVALPWFLVVGFRDYHGNNIVFITI